MFISFTKRSSVINLIYSGQVCFSYSVILAIHQSELNTNKLHFKVIATLLFIVFYLNLSYSVPVNVHVTVTTSKDIRQSLD